MYRNLLHLGSNDNYANQEGRGKMVQRSPSRSDDPLGDICSPSQIMPFSDRELVIIRINEPCRTPIRTSARDARSRPELSISYVASGSVRLAGLYSDTSGP